jgi:hypothetical protein
MAMPDEILKDYTEAMGVELGSACAVLYHRIVWLHLRWALYNQLFAKSERRTALLNETAGSFFGALQSVLFDDLVLDLARLTDPPRSAGKENLTLRRIPALISDPELQLEVRGLVEAAVSACASMRDWRNRRLAHADLLLALAPSVSPLPGIGHADMEAALLAVRELRNRVDSHYLHSTVAYEFVPTGADDGDALAHYLSKGLRAEQEWQKRIQCEGFTPEDAGWYEEV